MTTKLIPGSAFPIITVSSLDNKLTNIESDPSTKQWKMIVIYRGKHCPMCTKFLTKLEQYVARLTAINIDVIAISADSQEQLNQHAEKLPVSFPLYFGLTVEQMEQLGLYISHPRSAEETDHPFPEPGLFVINEQGIIHLIDISNNPFSRPNIATLVGGLEWIKENNYPIRGTYV